MQVRPGPLYRVPDLVALIEEHDLDRKTAAATFPRLGDHDLFDVLDMSVEAGWVSEDRKGRLTATERGLELKKLPDATLVLRLQLIDIVARTKPPWASPIVRGRRDFVTYLGPKSEIVQCFTEAGLLSGTDSHALAALDRMARVMRTEEDDDRLETGRTGERLSYEYEYWRTEKRPHWIAIDIAGAGYDIWSYNSLQDAGRLPIEVKSTAGPFKEASIFLSRNEWEVAKTHPNYQLHLWVLSGKPRLFVVDRSLILPHVPTDNDAGTWTKMRVPFKIFEDQETELPDMEEVSVWVAEQESMAANPPP